MTQAIAKNPYITGLFNGAFRGIDQQRRKMNELGKEKNELIKKEKEQSLSMIKTIGNNLFNLFPEGGCPRNIQSLLRASSYTNNAVEKSIPLLERLIGATMRLSLEGDEISQATILTNRNELAAAIGHPNHTVLQACHLCELKAICNDAWRGVAYIEFRDVPPNGGNDIEVHFRFL